MRELVQDKKNMKEILVTGADGQLGSCLKEIHSNYPEYVFHFTDYKELDICSQESISNFLDTHNIFAIIKYLCSNNLIVLYIWKVKYTLFYHLILSFCKNFKICFGRRLY